MWGVYTSCMDCKISISSSYGRPHDLPFLFVIFYDAISTKYDTFAMTSNLNTRLWKIPTTASGRYYQQNT